MQIRLFSRGERVDYGIRNGDKLERWVVTLRATCWIPFRTLDQLVTRFTAINVRVLELAFVQ